jgi:hypothetical protein
MAIHTLRSLSGRIVLVPALFCATAQGAFAQGASVEPTPAGSAEAGSTVTVKWSGPNDRGDYITVVRKGARPNDYLDYKPTSDGRAPVNPVSLVMPAEPGSYEIRYLRNNPREVLATVPFEVTAIAASLEGPASVAPDARFEVAWSGPNNRGDFVTIVAAGAAARAYGSYVDARSGTSEKKTGRTVATLRAPAQPGRYELRYVQQGTHIIGTRTIEVGASGAAASGAGVAGPGIAPSESIATIARTPRTDVTRAALIPAARTIAIAGFTASGTAVSLAARTIVLNGFTAAGSSVVVTPRTIAVPGFTASGTAVVPPPRTIALPGFTAAGESPTSRGLRR